MATTTRRTEPCSLLVQSPRRVSRPRALARFAGRRASPGLARRAKGAVASLPSQLLPSLAKSRPYVESYVENAPKDAPRHSEPLSPFTLPSKQPSRRATPRAALLCSRRSTVAAVPSSPPTAAAVRVWWLPGVSGAIQLPIAAEIAHAATCNARKSTISARCRSPRGRFERRLGVGSRLTYLGATTRALMRPSGASSAPPPRCLGGCTEVRREPSHDGMVVSTEV